MKIIEVGIDVMKICVEKLMGFFGKFFKDFFIEEMEVLWILLKKLYRFDGEE